MPITEPMKRPFCLRCGSSSKSFFSRRRVLAAEQHVQPADVGRVLVAERVGRSGRRAASALSLSLVKVNFARLRKGMGSQRFMPAGRARRNGRPTGRA